MNEKISCKGNGEKGTRCKYDSAWFCKNPACKTQILTSTLIGTCSFGCPRIYKWNCKDGG
jgi:hypothetical protein